MSIRLVPNSKNFLATCQMLFKFFKQTTYAACFICFNFKGTFDNCEKIEIEVLKLIENCEIKTPKLIFRKRKKLEV